MKVLSIIESACWKLLVKISPVFRRHLPSGTEQELQLRNNCKVICSYIKVPQTLHTKVIPASIKGVDQNRIWPECHFEICQRQIY